MKRQEAVVLAILLPLSTLFLAVFSPWSFLLGRDLNTREVAAALISGGLFFLCGALIVALLVTGRRRPLAVLFLAMLDAGALMLIAGSAIAMMLQIGR